MNFVCEWHLSKFETQDGEDYNTSELYVFTFHATLGDAMECAQRGVDSYNKLTDEHQAIFCNTVLQYIENYLVCKHLHTDFDYWRVYPVSDHWSDMWPHLMIYPPFVPDKLTY